MAAFYESNIPFNPLISLRRKVCFVEIKATESRICVTFNVHPEAEPLGQPASSQVWFSFHHLLPDVPHRLWKTLRHSLILCIQAGRGQHWGLKEGKRGRWLVGWLQCGGAVRSAPLLLCRAAAHAQRVQQQPNTLHTNCGCFVFFSNITF